MSNLHKIFTLGGGLDYSAILKNFCQNICNKSANKANFHFFPTISLWKLLSCHSNKSAYMYATAIKNNSIVEANV